jgi:quercetin dioxygenase-like cupin family protein
MVEHGAGVHVEPHSHPNDQIAWMLRGKMEFRLGDEQRVCAQDDVVVIPARMEHEAWFLEDTELIDFFAPPRDEFPNGRKTRLHQDEEATRTCGSQGLLIGDVPL